MIEDVSNIENVTVDKSAAVEVSLDDKHAKCGLCHLGHVTHPLVAGKLHNILGSTVHYFCMLFTAYSKQVGEENEGLFGFYGDEVKKQIEKASSKKCFYCSKTGATARCSKDVNTATRRHEYRIRGQWAVGGAWCVMDGWWVGSQGFDPRL